MNKIDINKVGRILLKVAGWIFGIVLGLIALVVIALQFPQTQRFLTNKAVTFLENKLQTEVQVGGINVAFPKEVWLQDFYIETPQKDTLLYLHSLQVDVDFFALTNQEIQINNIEIEGLRGEIVRTMPDSSFNFDFIIEAFASDTATTQQDTTSSPWKFSAYGLEIENTQFAYDDAVSGIDFRINIGNFDLELDEFNLDSMRFYADEFTLANTTASLVQTPTNGEISEEDTASEESTDLDLGLNEMDLENLAFNFSTPDILLDMQIGNSNIETELINLARQIVKANQFDLHNSEIQFALLAQDTTASSPNETTTTDTTEGISWGSGWKVYADVLDLSNNRVQFDNNSEPKATQGMDFNHLALSGLGINMENIVYTDDTIQSDINTITFKDASGFHLQKLATSLLVNHQQATLENFNVQINNSQIQTNLQASYPSLQAIADNPAALQFSFNMADTYLGIADLQYFQPDLLNTLPLQLSEQFQVRATADVQGQIDNLNINNFQLATLNNTSLQLNGTVEGLPNINQSRFDIDLSKFATTRQDIKSVTPDTLLPQQLQLPENINVSAKLSGLATDYRGQLDLQTSLGALTANWQARGDSAFVPDTYQANVALQQFNAGKLLNNEDTIGMLDMDAQVSGTGLSPDNMQAQLKATINLFEYLQYQYKDINIEATAEQQHYTAQVSMKDENLNFDLDGDVNMNKETPSYQLALKVENAFLKALNLTQDELKLKATLDVDLQIDSLNNLSGNAGLRNIAVYKNDSLYTVDSLLVATVNQTRKSEIKIDSDVMMARFQGNFGLTILPKALEQHFNSYYNLHDTTLASSLPSQQFEFEIDLKSTELITKVLVPQIGTFRPGKITGNYNSDQKLLNFNMEVPEITYGSNEVDSLVIKVNSNQNTLSYSLEAGHVAAGPAIIDNLSITGEVADNQIKTDLVIIDNEGTSKYRIPAEFTSEENNYRFHFMSDSLIFYYDNWQLPEDHYLEFGGEGFVANNFVLKNNGQELALETPNSGEDLILSFKDLGIKMLSGIASQDTLLVGGAMNGTLTTQTQQEGFAFTSDLSIQDFSFLEDTVGNLTVQANNKGESSVYNVDVGLRGNGNHVNIVGSYRADSTDSELDLTLDFKPLTLAAAESFSAGQLSDAAGFMRGSLRIEGTVTQPVINGDLTFTNTRFNVTYLNAPFSFDEQTLSINNNRVVFDQFTMQDQNDNNAVIDGTVSTDAFSVFAFDLKLQTDDFLLLNTNAEDNDMYYGELRADIDLDLTGNSDKPNVSLTLAIAEESNLTYVVPESNAGVVERQEIVKFVDMDQTQDPFFQSLKEEETEDTLTTTLTGMDLSANIDINDESTLNVVIDPIAGDMLTIQGNATLSLGINPAGDITLTGRYEVSNGSYNLSFYQFVKREFTVKPGSSLQWTGDPANPIFDLTAIHTVETSPLELVRNQVTDNVNQYRNELPFQVELILEGTLLKPEIGFNLDMPLEQRQAMQGVPYSKIQIINTRASELNKQVFSLLVLQRFMAENPFASPGSSVEATARSSVSKILTSQLNQLANQIGGVEITVDLSSYEDYSSGSAEGQTDLEVGLQKQFFNDRLSVQVGGNVNLEGQTQQQSLSDYAGDIIIEYKLTEDGRFRLTAFRKEVYEELTVGESVETGVGVIFVKDYDKLRNIFKKVGDEISNLNGKSAKK